MPSAARILARGGSNPVIGSSIIADIHLSLLNVTWESMLKPPQSFSRKKGRYSGCVDQDSRAWFRLRSTLSKVDYEALTVDTTPGIRTTGWSAVKPRSFMASPTWNSLPSLLNFQTSGMLLLRRFHSISSRDRSKSGSSGRFISYWFARVDTCSWRSWISWGSTKDNARSIPTTDSEI